MDFKERKKRAGEAIRNQRKQQGISSQDKLAELLTAVPEHGSITQASISLWESGEIVPETWRLPYVEQVLGFAPGTLARLYGLNVEESGEPTIDDVLALLGDLDERGIEAMRNVYEIVRRRPDDEETSGNS